MTTVIKHAVTKVPLVQLSTLDERLQCVRCGFLLNGPLQLQCSHRICTPCAMKLKQQRYSYSLLYRGDLLISVCSSPTFFCEKCQVDVEFTGVRRAFNYSYVANCYTEITIAIIYLSFYNVGLSRIKVLWVAITRGITSTIDMALLRKRIPLLVHKSIF